MPGERKQTKKRVYKTRHGKQADRAIKRQRKTGRQEDKKTERQSDRPGQGREGQDRAGMTYGKTERQTDMLTSAPAGTGAIPREAGMILCIREDYKTIPLSSRPSITTHANNPCGKPHIRDHPTITRIPRRTHPANNPGR